MFLAGSSVFAFILGAAWVSKRAGRVADHPSQAAVVRRVTLWTLYGALLPMVALAIATLVVSGVSTTALSGLGLLPLAVLGHVVVARWMPGDEACALDRAATVLFGGFVALELFVGGWLLWMLALYATVDWIPEDGMLSAFYALCADATAPLLLALVLGTCTHLFAYSMFALPPVLRVDGTRVAVPLKEVLRRLLTGDSLSPEIWSASTPTTRPAERARTSSAHRKARALS